MDFVCLVVEIVLKENELDVGKELVGPWKRSMWIVVGRVTYYWS